MNKIFISLICSIFLFNGCDFPTESQNKEKQEHSVLYESREIDQVFSQKITVILVNKPDSNSNMIQLQDYVVNGNSFIPVFTSKENFKASTGGVDIGKPLMEINGFVFLSLLEGNETIKVNPALSNELTISANELLLKYQEKIDSVKLQMQKLETEINTKGS